MTHPDSGDLAEYRAGLISGRRGARIAAHMADCDHCAGLSGRLAEISVLLASVPAPAMPDSVAQRLDTVLAAEAANRNDAERAGASGSRHRARNPRRSRRDRFRFVTVRVLAPAAVVVAVAAVGYSLSHLGGSTSSSAASSAAGTAAIPSASEKQAAPANGAESHAIPQYKPSPGFVVITSRVNYLPSILAQQLAAEMRAPTAAGRAQLPTAQIEACVSQLTRGTSPGTLKLVERAHFRGQPAIVVIASSGDGYMAWITGPGCSAAAGDVLAHTALP